VVQPAPNAAAIAVTAHPQRAAAIAFHARGVFAPLRRRLPMGEVVLARPGSRGLRCATSPRSGGLTLARQGEGARWQRLCGAEAQRACLGASRAGDGATFIGSRPSSSSADRKPAASLVVQHVVPAQPAVTLGGEPACIEQ
jgi:hypothetical protein